MLDREGLLQPRLARAAKAGQPVSADALQDLRAGIHVISLRAALREATALQRGALDGLLAALGDHFAALGRGRQPADLQGLLKRIDLALCSLLEAPRSVTTHRAVVAGVGLRRNLFPAAPDFQPREANA